MNDWTNVFEIDEYIKLEEEYLLSVIDFYRDGLVKNSDRKFTAMDMGIKMIDALYIADFLRKKQPKKILEVGSAFGLSARWILEKTAPWQAHLTLIDPQIHHHNFGDIHPHIRKFCAPFENRYKLINAFFSGKKQFINALSVKAEPVPVITEPFDVFDCAFIDGDHSFEITFLNMILAARMMPDGGHLLIHDVSTWPGAREAFDRFASIIPEINCYIAGKHFLRGVGRTRFFQAPIDAKKPFSLSIKKWRDYNHKRIARRRQLQFFNNFSTKRISSFRFIARFLANGIGVIPIPPNFDWDSLDLKALTDDSNLGLTVGQLVNLDSPPGMNNKRRNQLNTFK